MGHGLFQNSVAGLTLGDFKKFVEYWSRYGSLSLLVVSSCYAGGVNAEMIIEYIKKIPIYLTSEFPVIFESITDVTAISLDYLLKIDLTDNKSLQRVNIDYLENLFYIK